MQAILMAHLSQVVTLLSDSLSDSLPRSPDTLQTQEAHLRLVAVLEPHTEGG